MMLATIKNIIPKPLFSLYHYILAWLGNVLYSSPSKKLFLIGVTGTKGKTTTAYFIYQLLEKVGRKAALTSTTFFALENKIETNRTKMGMPGRFFLPRFLRRALRAGTQYAVVETTSEGIAQHRQRFLDYDVAVFTSLSPEHIERHGSFAAYREAKEKLFEQCKKTHILNLNDQHAEDFIKYPAKQKWGVVLDKKIPKSFVETPACLPARRASLLEGKITATNKLKINEWQPLNGKNKMITQSEVTLPFPGKFNAANLLLALAAGRTIGIPLKKLVAAVPKLKLPPGRMQELTELNVPFRVFLDYAHEPLSLKSALEACREQLQSNKKLICLVGAQGGGRDKWKRRVMGVTAAQYCDFVVVGTEDPYREDPDIINKTVLEGVVSNKNFREGKNCWKFTDRREAIRKILGLAGAGDIVILTGKGGEKKMCVGNKMIDWDEEEEVRKTLKNIKIPKPKFQ